MRPGADEVMDYRGLAAYLKLAPGTLRHWVSAGRIPFIKIGSSVRFAKARIDAWMLENSRGAKWNRHVAGRSGPESGTGLFPAGGQGDGE